MDDDDDATITNTNDEYGAKAMNKVTFENTILEDDVTITNDEDDEMIMNKNGIMFGGCPTVLNICSNYDNPIHFVWRRHRLH